jgi:Sulfatase
LRAADFQTLNRAGWALHVSLPIIAISTVVDVTLFCVLALLVAGIAWIFPAVSALRATAVLLGGLTAYDWLTVTARLSSLSRIVLALGVAFAVRGWPMKHEDGALRFWKKTLPWTGAFALLVVVGIPAVGWLSDRQVVAKLPAASPQAPNILVIVVDTLRADHLSSYGYSRRTSPNIDRLVRKGVVFENAVSACSWTYPSHVSLVTGRYLFEHGTIRPEKIELFATNKSNFGEPPDDWGGAWRGYRTGAFSGNRFFFTGNSGFRRGFIHFEDYYNSVADMIIRTLPGKEILRLYGKLFKKHLSAEWLEYGTNYGIRKRADEVNRELLSWIDRGGPHPSF